ALAGARGGRRPCRGLLEVPGREPAAPQDEQLVAGVRGKETVAEDGQVRVRRLVGVGEGEGELGEVPRASPAHRVENLTVEVGEVVGRGAGLGGHSGVRLSGSTGRCLGERGCQPSVRASSARTAETSTLFHSAILSVWLAET